MAERDSRRILGRILAEGDIVQANEDRDIVRTGRVESRGSKPGTVVVSTYGGRREVPSRGLTRIKKGKPED